MPLCNTVPSQQLGYWMDWTHSCVGTDEAVLLVSQLLGFSFTEIHTKRDFLLSEKQIQTLRRAVERRMHGEPIAYTLGTKAFREFKLKVTPAVLIPRFETELLVDIVAQLTPSTGRILDLGTGSGAIAIPLSKMNQYQVVAVDNDPHALVICAENRVMQDSTIKLIFSDWYDNVDGTFDTIVSNPPYIASQDPHLDVGDLKFEPRNALVAGPTGMEHLTEIIESAPEYLRPGGWLVVEHGHDQHKSVSSLFRKRGFENIQQRRDYADIPRFGWGQWDGR